jgi:hypothetical protein
MFMQGLGRNKRVLGIVMLIIGVILICVVIPPWLWCLIIGISVIILGIIFSRKRY